MSKGGEMVRAGWIMLHNGRPQALDQGSGYPYDARNVTDVRMTPEADMKRWTAVMDWKHEGEYVAVSATITLEWDAAHVQEPRP